VGLVCSPAISLQCAPIWEFLVSGANIAVVSRNEVAGRPCSCTRLKFSKKPVSRRSGGTCVTRVVMSSRALHKDECNTTGHMRRVDSD
jgi:hypothetical protein